MNTKDKILDGLLALILKKGASGLSVRAIAEEAGVNHGLVHHYFGSKEKLILALIDRESSKIRSKIIEVAKKDDLDTVRQALLKNVLMNKEFGKFLLEICQLGESIPSVREKLETILKARREMLHELLGLELPQDLMLVQSVILGIVMLQKTDPSISASMVMDRLFQLLNLD